MFTGLIEKKGIVKNLKLTSFGGEIEFLCDFSNPKTINIGDSISVNGVCLTVSSIKNNIYCADIMLETLNLTNLKNLKSGDIVNLERAMSVNSRYNGHIVQGHIDTTAKVEKVVQDGFSKKITFTCNTELIILKGSIAINGVSLTVSGVSENNFEVSLIPTTIKETNLENLKIDDTVNIEYDITGKYIKKFIENSIQKENKPKITEEFLRQNGF